MATGDTAKAGQTHKVDRRKRVSPPPSERQTDESDDTEIAGPQLLTEASSRREATSPLTTALIVGQAPRRTIAMATIRLFLPVQ
jgi:hypothetical protein